MLQIEQVVTQAAEHLIDRVRIPIVERGVRGHPRTDLVEVTVTGITLHDLVDVELTLGTGTDKGHVAHEDIPITGAARPSDVPGGIFRHGSSGDLPHPCKGPDRTSPRPDAYCGTYRC